MLRLDGGRSFTASELKLMRKRFKDWAKIAERLTPASGSVPASQEFQALASEDLALLHRLEDTLRRHVPHMLSHAVDACAHTSSGTLRQRLDPKSDFSEPPQRSCASTMRYCMKCEW